MRATYVTELGSPENIQVGQLDEPTLGALDVLVRTQALAVNFVDTLVRSGKYPTPKTFPFVIGRDLVGIVSTTGDAVEGFAIGDAVWSNSLGHNELQGSFSEYAAVPRDRLYPLPAGVDAKETVALVHSAATAYLALLREARLKYGDTVVVSGAAGAVGSTAMQFATASGAHVIATARKEDADWCKASGAELVFVTDGRDKPLQTELNAAGYTALRAFGDEYLTRSPRPFPKRELHRYCQSWAQRCRILDTFPSSTRCNASPHNAGSYLPKIS
jgi:NADPH:quinone reductase-like Zn-dependent oxidoreductase